MRPSDLFPAPKSASTKRLLELAARHDELKAEARGLQEQAAKTAAEQDESARELREAEARNKAFGDAAPRIKAARARLSKFEEVAAERADAARIVHDAAEQVDAEIRRHARQHSTSLWAELTKNNAGAAERLRTTIEAMAEALDNYTQAGVRAVELQKLANPETLRETRVPEPGGEIIALMKGARIASRDLRVPVPELPGQGSVVHLTETVESAA